MPTLLEKLTGKATADLQAKLDKAEAALKESDNALQAAIAENERLTKELDTANASVKDLTAKLAIAEKSATAQAANTAKTIVANLGVSPVPATEAKGPTDGKEKTVYEQYLALLAEDSTKAGLFYQTHVVPHMRAIAGIK